MTDRPTTPITVYTSAAAAVRAASSPGWHTLALALDSWTPAERDALAALVADTDRGPRIVSEPRERSPGDGWARVGDPIAGRSAYGDPRYLWALDVAPATDCRLREIIAALAQAQAQAQAKALAQAQAQVEQRAREEAAQAERARAQAERARIERIALLDRIRAAPVDLLDRHLRSDLQAAGRLDELLAYQRATEEREKAQAKAQAAALVDLVCSLAPELAPRARAGVLPTAERDAVLRKLLAPILDAAGPAVNVPPRIGRPSAPVDGLTEPEFAALTRARTATESLALPGGAAASAEILIANSRWEYDPNDPNCDADGDVKIDTRAARIVVCAEIAGVSTKATRWIATEEGPC